MTLELDTDFEVIMRDGDCISYLGLPRGSLYQVVPESLWYDLARIIEEYRGAIDNEREYRAGVEDTYRRNRL